MAYYDEFDYDRFWVGRDYEHRSEILALENLLSSRSTGVAVDVGGGYGRLTRWLAARLNKVYLVEPAAKMRREAKKFLQKYPQVIIRPGTIQDTGLPAKCADIALSVRVLHHIPQPEAAIVELKRILKPGGLLVLEFANSNHFLARVKSWLRRKPILPVPAERRSRANIAARTISFVNHHPLTIQKLLKRQGLQVIKILSVSNLRWPLVKKIVPLRILMGLELWLQEKLAGLYFGPSIFILAQKA